MNQDALSESNRVNLSRISSMKLDVTYWLSLMWVETVMDNGNIQWNILWCTFVYGPLSTRTLVLPVVARKGDLLVVNRIPWPRFRDWHYARGNWPESRFLRIRLLEFLQCMICRRPQASARNFAELTSSHQVNFLICKEHVWAGFASLWAADGSGPCSNSVTCHLSCYHTFDFWATTPAATPVTRTRAFPESLDSTPFVDNEVSTWRRVAAVNTIKIVSWTKSGQRMDQCAFRRLQVLGLQHAVRRTWHTITMNKTRTTCTWGKREATSMNA
jgi:hypothetical protein